MKVKLDQQGQAFVEYMLILLAVVSVVTVLGMGFRKSLFKIWTVFTQEIAAACPTCPPNTKYKLR